MSLFESKFPYSKEKGPYTCCLCEVHYMLKEKSCKYKQLFSCSQCTFTVPPPAAVQSPPQLSCQCAQALKDCPALGDSQNEPSSQRATRFAWLQFCCKHRQVNYKYSNYKIGKLYRLHCVLHIDTTLWTMTNSLLFTEIYVVMLWTLLLVLLRCVRNLGITRITIAYIQFNAITS